MGDHMGIKGAVWFGCVFRVIPVGFLIFTYEQIALAKKEFNMVVVKGGYVSVNPYYFYDLKIDYMTLNKLQSVDKP